MKLTVRYIVSLLALMSLMTLGCKSSNDSTPIKPGASGGPRTANPNLSQARPAAGAGGVQVAQAGRDSGKTQVGVQGGSSEKGGGLLSPSDLKSHFDASDVESDSKDPSSAGFKPTPISGKLAATEDFTLSRGHYFDEGILTGAALTNDRRYSDALNDSIMLEMVQKMKNLPSSIAEDSRYLAERVRAFTLSLQSDGQIEAQVDIFENRQLYQVMLRGAHGDSNQKISLGQYDVDRAGGFQFEGELSCLDGSTCHVAVLKLNQMSNGKICKTIYLVSRKGSAFFYMSQAEYNEFYGGQASSIRNDGQKEFMKFLANTVLYNKQCQNVQLNEFELRAGSPPLYARSLDLETWSVAYGPSSFSLKFVGNQSGVSDLIVLGGPLVTGNGTSDVQQNLEFSGLVSHEFQGQFRSLADYFARVVLNGNDGRGNLGFRITYKGEPTSESQLEIKSLLQPAVGVTSESF